MQLSTASAKLLIYQAFIEDELGFPKHLARRVHELYPFCAGLSSAAGVRAQLTTLASRRERTSMSFSRHEEIYRSDVGLGKAESGSCYRRSQQPIGLDEFPAGYSLAGCPPAEPASASPTANDFQQRTLPYNDFSANGNNPLNSVSQFKGALQIAPFPCTPSPKTNPGRLHRRIDTPHANEEGTPRGGSISVLLSNL